MTDPYASLPNAPAPPQTPPQTDPYAAMQDPYASLPNAPAQQPPPPSGIDRAIATAKAITPGTLVGGVEGAARTLAGLLDMANKPMFPGIAKNPNEPVIPQIKQATDWVRTHTEPQTTGEKLGNVGEMMGELSMGGGEKAATDVAEAAPKLSEHLAGLQKLTKAMEDYPIVKTLMGTADHPLAKTLTSAVSGSVKGAARAGAEQAAQTYVKTGDVGQAEQAGTVGAATGGILGLGAGAISGAMKAAAAKLPEIQSAIASAESAPSRFMDSATNTLQRALDRLGLGDKAMPAVDYGQAADQLSERASGIYDEADAVTNGKWRDYNADYQAAKASGDKAKIDAARQKLDDLATGSGDANYDQALRETTDRARTAFHDHYTLRNIHDSLVKAFDFGTPETAAMKGSKNVFSGKELGKQLTNLERDPDVGRDRMVELMGEDGYKALNDLSETAKNPAQNQNAKDIIQEVATKAHQKGSTLAWVGGMLGQFLPTGWGKTAAAGYAAGSLLGGGEAAADKLLTYAATKPALVKLLNYAAQKGISPRYGAALFGTAINQSLQKDAAQTQAQTPPQ